MRAPSPYHSTPDAVVRALIEARRLIGSPDRWRQGTLLDCAGRMCIEGAIRKATVGEPDVMRDCMRILRMILGIPHNRIRALFDWNGQPRRRHSEVTRLLDDAAERAEWIMCPGEVPA